MADYVAIYDRVHAEHPGYQSPNHSPGLRLVVENETRLKAAGPRHIDLGCGAGFVVEHLRSCGLDSVGADVSPVAVEAANARLGPGAAVIMRERARAV